MAPNAGKWPPVGKRTASDRAHKRNEERFAGHDWTYRRCDVQAKRRCMSIAVNSCLLSAIGQDYHATRPVFVYATLPTRKFAFAWPGPLRLDRFASNAGDKGLLCYSPLAVSRFVSLCRSQIRRVSSIAQICLSTAIAKPRSRQLLTESLVPRPSNGWSERLGRRDFRASAVAFIEKWNAVFASQLPSPIDFTRRLRTSDSCNTCWSTRNSTAI